MKQRKSNLGDAVQSFASASHRSSALKFRSLRTAAIAGDLSLLTVQVASSQALQSQLGQEVKACRNEIQRAFDSKTLSASRSPGAGQLLELDARVACEIARKAVNAILV